MLVPHEQFIGIVGLIPRGCEVTFILAALFKNNHYLTLKINL